MCDISDSEDDSRNKNCAALLITHAHLPTLSDTVRRFANFSPSCQIRGKIRVYVMQRVLNDLWKPWLPRHRIIWLLPLPLSATHRKTERDNFLTGDGGGGWRWWGRNQIIRQRQSPVLYSILSGLMAC